MGIADWLLNKFEQGSREHFYKSIQSNYNRWFTTYATAGSDNPHMFAVIKTFESATKYYRLNINQFYIYSETAIFQIMDKDTTLRVLPLYIATIVKTPDSEKYYDVLEFEFNNIVNSQNVNSATFKSFIEAVKTIKDGIGSEYEYLTWYAHLNIDAKLKLNKHLK